MELEGHKVGVKVLRVAQTRLLKKRNEPWIPKAKLSGWKDQWKFLLTPFGSYPRFGLVRFGLFSLQ